MSLKNKKILLIGGDDRYLEVVRTLHDLKASVLLAGYEKAGLPSFDHVQMKNLQDVDFSDLDAVLLPVSGTDKEGNIMMTSFTDLQLCLTEEMISKLPPSCGIYTGVSGPFLNHMGEKLQKQIIPIFAREDIAIYNSIPTAEGTLQLAMEQTDYTMHGASVMVLGFGKVGVTTARLFSSVGSHVSVAIRKDAAAARVREMGLKACAFSHLAKEIGNYQIIINTVPDLVLDKKLLESTSKEALIIDLASSPGGVDFTVANALGIRTIHALGLPGKVAPKTAGRIIADTFVSLLDEEMV